MIAAFVKIFEEKKHELREMFEAELPKSYCDIVRTVVELLCIDFGSPDPNNIHIIDDGDYQGTLLFIIPEEIYQPVRYWAVKVSYGSCSVCDTMEAILDNRHDPKQQVDACMTLALHIVQGLQEI